jgi:hypothetical protein
VEVPRGQSTRALHCKIRATGIRNENIEGYEPFVGKKKFKYYLKLIKPYRGRMAAIFYYYAVKGKIIAQKKRTKRLFSILKNNGILHFINYIKSKTIKSFAK